ncbi:MAG: hypothetical protein KGL39_00645 [Patescibacteria group bacterium]|nr:hypothetical protein [Patescibacteria group bacterium]
MTEDLPRSEIGSHFPAGYRPAEDDLLASVCKESFVDFVKEFWDTVPGAGKLIWNWHLDVFCKELQEIAMRVHRWEPAEYDIVCNVCFGASKSTIWSILFQPWTWTFFPQARHLNSSHTESLVLDLANKSRAVVNSEKYRTLFPHVQFNPSQDTKGYFTNTLGGDRYSATVGGKSPMGFHAHFLACDDPLDPRKALSQVETRNAADFIMNYLPTRMVDKSVSVMSLVMQRIGKGDPTDVMLELGRREGARPVRLLCLPAELTDKVQPTELRDKYVDGLMDPIRLSRRVLGTFRAKGEFYYAAQCLQDPVALGGGMFRLPWFSHRVKAAPYRVKARIRGWDRAATENSGCATAGVLMSRGLDDYYYVEDVVWGQWEPNERNDIIYATALKDRARYGPNYEPTIVIEGERGSTGAESFQYLARRLAGFRIKEDLPSGSKDTRAEPWASQLAAGNVRIVDNGQAAGTGQAQWDVVGYVDEHCNYRPVVGKRVGGLVDRIDSSSMTFNLLSGQKSPGTLYVFQAGTNKRNRVLKIVVCSVEELTTLAIEPIHTCLLVTIQDPKIINEESNGSEETESKEVEACSLPHSIQSLAGSLDLFFPNLHPVDFQDRWEESIPPWNKRAAELIMNQSHGKSLWAFLKKKREPSPDVYVIGDDGDGSLALSVGLGICDVLHVSRQATLYRPGSPDSKFDGMKASNEHIYQMVRSTRGLVL